MNTNVQAITFANTRIRPMADELYSAYLSAKNILAQWNAQSVSSVIANDATVIADGSQTDGRPQITGAAATNILSRAQELVNWIEGPGVLNTIVAVQVNGASRF